MGVRPDVSDESLIIAGDGVDEFDEFVHEVEPRLRRALVAAYGARAGREAAAAADALAWAWEHFDRVRRMRNPGGCLWRVGQTAARRNRSGSMPLRVVVREDSAARAPHIEPGLQAALTQLTPSQRAATLLINGWGYTFREAADALGSSVSTVRVHNRRGLAKLRGDLGVENDA